MRKKESVRWGEDGTRLEDARRPKVSDEAKEAVRKANEARAETYLRARDHMIGSPNVYISKKAATGTYRI